MLLNDWLRWIYHAVTTAKLRSLLTALGIDPAAVKGPDAQAALQAGDFQAVMTASVAKLGDDVLGEETTMGVVGLVQGALGMGPAQQRLQADHLAAAQVDLRLVVQQQLVVGQRAAQP